VALLVIETTFSNRERPLAQSSLHLAPHALADELGLIAPGKKYPIYITHTKPAETERIRAEIQCFDQANSLGDQVRHDIRRLRAGQALALGRSC
jgi:hypothetical protein